MKENSKVFLIYEPAENTDTIGLKDDEPSWISQLVVGAVLANSIEEAASSIGGRLEVRDKKESIVWLPEEHFVEVWKGKRYKAGTTPKDIEEGFEDLLWQLTPTQAVSLGLISPLRSLVKEKRGRFGLAIREIPLLPGSSYEDDITKHTKKEWQKLSSEERRDLLRGLAASTPGYQPTWWGGISFEVLADVNDFDDLPGDLCGRLRIAVTEKGFSIDENRRVEGILSS